MLLITAGRRAGHRPQHRRVPTYYKGTGLCCKVTVRHGHGPGPGPHGNKWESSLFNGRFFIQYCQNKGVKLDSIAKTAYA